MHIKKRRVVKNRPKVEKNSGMERCVAFLYLCAMQPWRFFFGVLFAVLPAALPAQQPALNPFDISGRLPQNLQALARRPADAPAAAAANPFNVVPHRAPGAARGISESIERTFRPLEVLPTGNGLSNIVLFWLLVTLVAFLSFSIAAKRSIIIKAWRGFLNDNALSIAQKEATGLIGSTPYYLLYASFLLNAGAFIFLIARHFNPQLYNNPGFLAVCMLLSAVLFLSKHGLLALVRLLYPVQAEIRRYNFLIVTFNCVLGLFLAPFNFLIAFSRQYSDFMVFWTLALAGIFYLYRSLRAAAIGRKFLGGHLFHFLLYLCTVEIAPAVILVKLAMLASK
ncbi:MAG: DUF4271 domain-containing protein [Saprospirales bacterium]|nr:DUF4271 domain-containing protein [Saprospirales bacterium]